MKNSNVLVGFMVIFLLSCQKAENRSCFKTTGKEISLELPLYSFDKLELYEHVEYQLIQDSLDKIVLFGGKHVVSKIETEIADSKLTIRNNNKCKFLRSYRKKIKAEIHFTNLVELNYHGTELLSNVGVLNFPTSFYLSILSTSGSVNLNLNANAVFAGVAGGFGDFTLSGKVNYANLNVDNNGFCNTYSLEVKDSINVISNTMGVMKVNTDKTIVNVDIKKGGPVYYRGTPSKLKVSQIGNGKLIQEF